MDDIAEQVRLIGQRLEEAELAHIWRSWRADIQPVVDPIRGTFVFAEVAPHTVALEVRQAVAFAVKWTANDELLEYMPDIGWFVPETDHDRSYVAKWGTRDWAWHECRPSRSLHGYTRRDGKIWLNATLDLEQAVETAAHEVRHLSQYLGHTYAEPDALDYADRVKGRILASLR